MEMVDIETLALQLYSGKVETDKACETVIEDNKRHLRDLSCFVALVNKSFFIEKLKQKLTTDEYERIKCVDGSEEKMYTDRFGRCTYFYVPIASKKFWIF